MRRILRKQQEQDAAEKKASEPRKPMGFIAVSIGEGINNILKNWEWTTLSKAVRR